MARVFMSIEEMATDPELAAAIAKQVLFYPPDTTVSDVVAGMTIMACVARDTGDTDTEFLLSVAGNAMDAFYANRKALEAVQAVVQEDATSGTRMPSDA